MKVVELGMITRVTHCHASWLNWECGSHYQVMVPIPMKCGFEMKFRKRYCFMLLHKMPAFKSWVCALMIANARLLLAHQANHSEWDLPCIGSKVVKNAFWLFVNSNRRIVSSFFFIHVSYKQQAIPSIKMWCTCSCMIKSYHARFQEKKLKVVGKTLRRRKNFENNYVFTTMLLCWLTPFPMLSPNA